jgi:hypothetical protein
VQPVSAIGRAAYMDQHGLRTGVAGRGEQTDAVGDYGGLGVRRTTGHSRNALLQIDDYDGGAARIEFEVKFFVAHR